MRDSKHKTCLKGLRKNQNDRGFGFLLLFEVRFDMQRRANGFR